MDSPIITHCTQAQIWQILEKRHYGWSWQRLADKFGFSRGALNRYSRVYEDHGLQAFASE